ncbi:MAG: hypothetical protein WCV62_01595 [Candidatus Peribacteraceae bacterium]|jgi:predicted phage terminase large subunit-like protein
MGELIPDLRRKLLKDRVVRRALTRQSHHLFFHCYFPHYVKFKTAAFQREMFQITEEETYQTVVVTAFRGSAKSTILNMSFVLWSILGKPGKKFVILVGQTQAQARQHLKNIKEELESNSLLRGDLGPFREEEDEWRNSCLVISNYDAKIMAVSIDQSVRGLRHKENRPDLIICDDIEDLPSVKTREGRDKTYNFVKGELIPAGDPHTRIVFVGNLLHEDCLLKRLQREVAEETLQGTYREYPLLAKNGQCLWPGKYPTEAAIEAERRRVGSEIAWQREFLLRIISDYGVVIRPEWIQYYEHEPYEEPVLSAIGIDLAISQEDSADFTSIVCGKVYVGNNRKGYLYVLPNPINARLTALGTIEHVLSLVDAIKGRLAPMVYVEDVGYQGAMTQLLRHQRLRARGVKVHGDKRSRLALISTFIQSGRVLFPEHGCEELISQLTGFGSELHDDLVDALVLLISQLTHSSYCRMYFNNYLEQEEEPPSRFW